MSEAPLTAREVAKAYRFFSSSERLQDSELLSLVDLPKTLLGNVRGLDIDTQQDLVAMWAIVKWTGTEEFSRHDVELMRLLLARLPEVLLQPFSPSLVAAATGFH